MHCSNCGREIAHSDRLCPSCGHKNPDFNEVSANSKPASVNPPRTKPRPNVVEEFPKANPCLKTDFSSEKEQLRPEVNAGYVRFCYYLTTLGFVMLAYGGVSAVLSVGLGARLNKLAEFCLDYSELGILAMGLSLLLLVLSLKKYLSTNHCDERIKQGFTVVTVALAVNVVMGIVGLLVGDSKGFVSFSIVVDIIISAVYVYFGFCLKSFGVTQLSGLFKTYGVFGIFFDIYVLAIIKQLTSHSGPHGSTFVMFMIFTLADVMILYILNYKIAQYFGVVGVKKE